VSLCATAAGELPEGYTQLPFLKATRNCQVKTGLTPASTDTAVLTFELSTVSGNQNLWCSRNDSTNSFTAFMIANKVRLDRNTTQGTSAAGLAVGTKYTLTDAELENSFPLGVSNEWAADAATVSVTAGTLLIVLSKL
jgi:thiamine pyrophosphokinase